MYTDQVGVYYILNLKNSRVYVGQTTNIGARLRQHRNDLKAGRHVNVALQSDWSKTGEAGFEIGILTTVSTAHPQYQEQLRDIERTFIRAYQSDKPEFGYNVVSGPTPDPNINPDDTAFVQHLLDMEYDAHKCQDWNELAHKIGADPTNVWRWRNRLSLPSSDKLIPLIMKYYSFR